MQQVGAGISLEINDTTMKTQASLLKMPSFSEIEQSLKTWIYKRSTDLLEDRSTEGGYDWLNNNTMAILAYVG